MDIFLLVEYHEIPIIAKSHDINKLVLDLLKNGWKIENSINDSNIYYIGGNGKVKTTPNRLMYIPDNSRYVEGYIIHHTFIITKKVNINGVDCYTSLNETELKKYKKVFDENSIIEAKNLFD